MDPVISVQNVGKVYHISKKGPQETDSASSLFSHAPAMASEEFWALQDISFDVLPGERVGIIGSNGAGKSTILKLLSRITEPSTGRITLRGRVASLLEVGTGFHPELTGRENIFLNGAILGMSNSEIKAKFDEIVAFAGVEKFLDVPVKRYSSGMYVRLGFAIAAHLDPEVLIIDEVLAVGDFAFQQRCLGKLEEVSNNEGKTILFVSHSMGMVQSVCNRGILLQDGKLVCDAPTEEAIAKYTGIAEDRTSIDFTEHEPVGDDKARLLKCRLTRNDGTESARFDLNEPFQIHMEYEILCWIDGPAVPNLHFTNSKEEHICVNNMPGISDGLPGRYSVSCQVPAHLFNAGLVHVGFALTSYPAVGFEVHFWEKSALSVTITEDIENYQERYAYRGEIPGGFRPSFFWSGGRVNG